MNLDDRRSTNRTYDFLQEGGTWTVYNCESGSPAVLNGVPQIGLGLNEADALAAVLNRVEIQLAASRMANEAWEWTRPSRRSLSCGKPDSRHGPLTDAANPGSS
jgi:hypothetical protein